MKSGEIMDVQTFIDQSPIGPRQFRLVALCVLIMLIEGYDTTVVGYIAPALHINWRLQPQDLAPLFGIGLLGLSIGSLALGPIADRIGRKALLVASVALFGATSLTSAFAPSLDFLLVLRFLTGLGLGGAMPNAYTLAAEYSPTRSRASLIAPIGCGMAAGGALGGLLAGKVLAGSHWQLMFMVGGIVPLLLVPVLLICLPESVRYKIVRGAPDQEIRATLRAMFPNAKLDGIRFTYSEKRLSGFPVQHLFRGGRVRETLLLWLMSFGTLLVIYFLGNWLPLLVQRTGAPPGTGATMMAYYLLGSTIGAIGLGVMMDRYKPQIVICVTMLVAAVSLRLLDEALHTPSLALLALFIIGTGTGGTMTGTNIMATVIYPTAARATGVGWALAFGRIGSIVGATIVASLLALGWSLSNLFAAAAATLLCAALCSLCLRGAGTRKRDEGALHAPTDKAPSVDCAR